VKPEHLRKIVLCTVLLLVSGAYAYLTFATPSKPAAPGFDLHEPWKTVIQITLMLPIILSWAFGAFAVEYLMTAARRTSEPKSALMLRRLGYGVLALVIGSWITTVISQVRNVFFANDAFLSMVATIATNYAYVVFPLLGFTLIYLASLNRAPQKDARQQSWPPALLLIGILGTLWVGIIFTNGARQTSNYAYGQPTYYLSDPLIVLTLITPTLAAWLLGITGALNFSDLESGGSAANRKAFTQIVHGLLIAVFNSMILNGLLSAGSERLIGGGLAFLLAIIYVFVFFAVVSYWMICRGAKNLLIAPYEHQK
jgi:hypothetical protein